MALRDKLADRVAPHLEPGEELRQVFMAQSGPSPYWIFLTWFTMFWNRYLIVVVTDRSLVTFRATAFKPSFVKKPPEIVRHDRTGTLGPCSGLWGRIDLDGTKFYVHRRFHKDIAAADAQVGQLTTQPASTPVPQEPDSDVPAGWYPDPHNQAPQRYWDGSTWTDHTA